MRPRIAVVGSCNLDQMLSVPVAPGPGTTASAADYVEEPGGKGLNQALAAARMGAEVCFVGAVGDDDAGRLVRRVLTDSGVDVGRLRQIDGHTGRAVIVVEDTGDNRIVLLSGANGSVVSLDADDRAAVSRADALLLQLELPQQVAREAAWVAREADVLVALTPAPAQPIEDELLAATSILFANEHEMTAYTRERDVTLGLLRLLDLVPAVVVTRGDRGSDYADRTGFRYHVDALPVDPTDTTAAGDVYAGVFITARCSGSSIPEAMQRATLAASVAVQRRGTSGSIPTAAELSAIQVT